MEARGQEPRQVLGTLHFGSVWPETAQISRDYVLPNKRTIADFCVYAFKREPGEMRWYVDGVLSQTHRFWWSSSRGGDGKGARPATESDLHPWPPPFHRKFRLVMNLVVGGRFLGDPDRSTPFPAKMVIDYVRVYDRVDGYGPGKPRGTGKIPFAK